ncbi:MAG: hypothetical protein H7289_07720 [Mucilaginibacter sp.]|nr:hypothetical protein [Mucilaginibacter sp.]
MEGILLLLKLLLKLNKPKDLAEKLVRNIVFKVYQRLRAQSEVVTLKPKGYSLSLNENEALALYVYLQNVGIANDLYKYEALQLTRVFNEIDKQYA